MQQMDARYYRQDQLEHIGGLQALEQEYSYWVGQDQIIGEIPAGLTGTMYRIGPGRNRIGQQNYGHWFDGDGMVHAFSFTPHGVWYRNKYVRTPKYLAETQHQKVMFRGFGTNKSGGVAANIGRLPENAANTSLIYHAGKLLALWEGGRPWQIDPITLQTMGEYTFDGKLGALNAFSAHGKICPKTKHYFNHGVGFGKKGTQLSVYKINAQGALMQKQHFSLPFAAFIHDFSFAGDYLVYWVHPLGIKNPIPFVLGQKTFNDSVQYQPAWGMHAIIICAKTLKEIRRIKLDPCVIVHTGNAWQDGNTLVLNVIRFENFAINDWLSNVLATDMQFDVDILKGGESFQYHLDLSSGEYEKHHQDQSASEFPQWDLRYSGQATRYQYGVATVDRGYGGSLFFNAIQMFDAHHKLKTLNVLKKGQFSSEAVFLPTGSEEGKGYLGTVIYDAFKHCSAVVIFDPQNELREVARIPLRNHVPFGFHGGYSVKISISGIPNPA